MRVLLANYRYFAYGGPERYLFAVQHGLESREHEVVPFSIAYSRNETTPYSGYFVPPLAGPDEVRFEQHRWTLSTLRRTLERSFYSREVEQAVVRLVDDQRPDVAYVLHFLKKLSPSLLVGLKSRNIPVVVRLSDLLLICPEAHLTRNGQTCTLCTEGSLWPSIRHRCVRGSLGASIVHYLSWHYHRLRRFFDLVDKFVVPSETTREWMVRAGWPEDKFECIPTFVDDLFFENTGAKSVREPQYILYVGLLEEHKGVEPLIKAYHRAISGHGGGTPFLKIAADTSSRGGKRCRQLADSLGLEKQVEFLGFMDRKSLPSLYHHALFTVVPSLCFENMPNVLCESYAAGTPVLGSDHGSIAPLIQEGVTGMKFPSGDIAALAHCLRSAWNNPGWCSEAGRSARAYAENHFEQDRHLSRLEDLFERVV